MYLNKSKHVYLAQIFVYLMIINLDAMNVNKTISQLESKKCSCGKKFSWVQKDGITRTRNTCGDCMKNHETKINNNNSFNWKRKRCLS